MGNRVGLTQLDADQIADLYTKESHGKGPAVRGEPKNARPLDWRLGHFTATGWQEVANLFASTLRNCQILEEQQ